MTWRVIDTTAASGAWNMAVDEVLLEQAAHGQCILRFYRWQPAAVSLGYFQKIENEVDREECLKRGFDIVRRLTGGRGGLHHHELTYSVACPEAVLPASVVESYRVLSLGLVAGLRALSIPAEIASRPQPGIEGPSAACFDTPSWYEIILDGKKLVGSAQTRRQGATLQHGSLLLKRNTEEMAAVVPLPPEKRTQLQRVLERKSCALADLGYFPAWDELTRALTMGISGVTARETYTDQLTFREEERARELMVTKYASPQWTDRR